MRRWVTIATRRAISLLPLTVAALPAQQPPRREFTKQALLVAPFHVDSAPATLAAAREFADKLRDRLEHQLDRRDVQVIGDYLLGNALAEADYKRNAILGEVELRLAAGKVRADEIIFGRVQRTGTMLVVAARMARLRNWTMQQPLPVVRAATPALAADLVAAEVVKARAQLASLRRCENALMQGARPTAVREAESAIRAYPRAVIARDCLLAALFDGKTGADSLLRVADEALAIDTANTFAAVSRAQALEALKRPREAVAQWRRISAWHPDSLSLGRTVVEAFLRLQEPTAALATADALETRFGADAELRRFRFRGEAARAVWPHTARLGDTLEVEDATFRADSSYATRYVEALRQVGDTLAALEAAVRSIRRFPGDGRLYLQYLQLLGLEQPMALPRGLQRFPDIPELHLLAAQAARRAGNRSAAIRASREALRRDTLRTPLYLQLADLYLEDQAPDSAITVLRRAPRGGDAGESVRAYILARGLLLVRAAADTGRLSLEQGVALLTLADSIASREDSRAMTTAASLQLARLHLVLASRSRQCREVDEANGLLRQVSPLLEHGVGASSTEITSAFDAMQHAVEDAHRILCPPLPDPPSP